MARSIKQNKRWVQLRKPALIVISLLTFSLLIFNTVISFKYLASQKMNYLIFTELYQNDIALDKAIQNLSKDL
jgi:hypothetical protein